MFEVQSHYYKENVGNDAPGVPDKEGKNYENA
jgi:hypothetical protein